MNTGTRSGRGAFTLVELLVVVALIMILAGLAAAFLPTIGDSARAARGASDLQQWILTAKQKALRDQVPCGLRLIPFTDPVTGVLNSNQARQCQYIEQPDPYPSAVGSTLSTKDATNLNQVTLSLNVGDQVTPGIDYLEVFGSGLMHLITGNPTPSTLNLNSPLPFAVSTPTQQYRIVRGPRVTGDDILQLPDSVIIDLKTNKDYKNPLPSSDILFSPSGAVISSGVSTDSINLWVRDYDPMKNNKSLGQDPEKANPLDGEQTIIAVYVRSGLTAAHPPAVGSDPYKFIKDGRTSGK